MSKEYIKSDEKINDLRDRIRHSAAHLLAESVLKIYPETKLTIGPPIDDGFYYDFDIELPFTPEDLKKIEKQMLKSIRMNTEFIEREVSRDEASRIVKTNPYKMEILNAIPNNEKVTFCSHANGAFEDLCRGGHVERTGDIKAVKLLSTAGAYWRGDENNKMLQRIYGTAWESIQAQKDYLKKREEAEKRDHRKIGRELGLFFFDPIAPASPFFLPKGTVLINELQKFVRELYARYGYKEVMTPQIFNTDLWKLSGHYDNYSENMYFIDIDDKEYGVKPMNCPAAAVLYSAEAHSYRELPLRYADFGRLHRYERSGVTHGLTRVRSMTQDDAHIFCTLEQVGGEVRSFLDMLEESYQIFTFDKPRLTLSLRPAKRVGTDEMWDLAEQSLEEILSKSGHDYQSISGEGAFYGPKIDIFVPDALGREWQLGTVQLDFSLPERFNLEYAAETGEREKVVVIHRAMLGTLERFLGVLIEHLGGAFPTWLAPIQTVVIPIADRHEQYASAVSDKLHKIGIRSSLNNSRERMNSKIRTAQLQKVPYMLIIGDQEQQSDTVSIRTRSGQNIDPMPMDDFISQLILEISQRSNQTNLSGLV